MQTSYSSKKLKTGDSSYVNFGTYTSNSSAFLKSKKVSTKSKGGLINVLDKDKDDAKDSISESNMAAFGPQEEIQLPEINFTPSGNTPDIDLGAPPYDLNVAERRRQNFLTMKHTIKEKMELYTASTKGKLEELKDALTNPSK